MSKYIITTLKVLQMHDTFYELVIKFRDDLIPKVILGTASH